MIDISVMVIAVSAFFMKVSFLDYIILGYICYIIIELKFLKELMLIKDVNQMSVIVVIIDIS